MFGETVFEAQLRIISMLLVGIGEKVLRKRMDSGVSQVVRALIVMSNRARRDGSHSMLSIGKESCVRGFTVDLSVGDGKYIAEVTRITED